MLTTCVAFGAGAADFRELDRSFSRLIRGAIADPTYHEVKLTETAKELGLVVQEQLFSGLAVRQSIAQGLDQIAKSSVESSVKAGKAPAPDVMQNLVNLLATLQTLDEAEAKSGPESDVAAIKARVFAVFVDPLIARTGRRDLRALAGPAEGILVVQYLGATAEGGVRVLDLYAQPSARGLTWSLKTFAMPFPKLKSVLGRAYPGNPEPRADGKLGLYVDLGHLAGSAKKRILGQVDELDQAGLVVILDDSAARVDACIREEQQEREANHRSRKGGKASDGARARSADAVGVLAEEAADIKRQCIAELRRPAFDQRAVLFDPQRNLELFSGAAIADGAELDALLDKARYAVKRWP